MWAAGYTRLAGSKLARSCNSTRPGCSLLPPCDVPSRYRRTALAEKVAALEAEEVFTERAARANPARFLEVVERLGTESPQPGDEVDEPALDDAR